MDGVVIRVAIVGAVKHLLPMRSYLVLRTLAGELSNEGILEMRNLGALEGPIRTSSLAYEEVIYSRLLVTCLVAGREINPTTMKSCAVLF